jgi:hypothetical protein
MKRRTGGPQSQGERYREEKDFCSCPELNHDFLVIFHIEWNKRVLVLSKVPHVMICGEFRYFSLHFLSISQTELIVGITFPVTLLAGKGLGNYVKYRSVVLEKDGDQLDRPFAKWNIAKSEGGEDYPANNERIKAKLIGCILNRNCLLKHVIVGKIRQMTVRRRRRRKQLLDDIRERVWYCKLKNVALDLTPCRSRFCRGYGAVERLTALWMLPPLTPLT